MPGMGGWECLKQLRAADSKLPIVITTGYAGENLPERATKEGASGLICKPYEVDVLLRTVRELLDKSPA
jgi:DNA-binding NarL/FixJ family response regulator